MIKKCLNIVIEVHIKLNWFSCHLCTAGLRRSFRLSRKNSMSQQGRQKMVEGHGSIPELIYMEVLPYHREPGEPYRLVLLTGEEYFILFTVTLLLNGTVSAIITLMLCQTSSSLYNCLGCLSIPLNTTQRCVY